MKRRIEKTVFVKPGYDQLLSAIEAAGIKCQRVESSSKKKVGYKLMWEVEVESNKPQKDISYHTKRLADALEKIAESTLKTRCTNKVDISKGMSLSVAEDAVFNDLTEDRVRGIIKDEITGINSRLDQLEKISRWEPLDIPKVVVGDLPDVVVEPRLDQLEHKVWAMQEALIANDSVTNNYFKDYREAIREYKNK